MIWPIATKFGMVMHFDPLDPSTPQISTFWKSKMAVTAILKNRKSPYLSSGLTDLREIWHDDAYCSSTLLYRPLKFRSFKKPRWRTAAIFKIEKSPYISNGLNDRHQIWHDDALWPSWPFRPLKFRKYKNKTRRQPPFWKIDKSPYFSIGLTNHPEIWHGDAFWQVLVDYGLCRAFLVMKYYG